MNIVVQRYLLAASSVVTSIAANTSQFITATTASIPLSGQWTIRLRNQSSFAQAQDNSGSLQIEVLTAVWQLFNAQGTSIYNFQCVASEYTPYFTFPKITGVSVSKTSDLNQVVASFDQIGGVVTSVAVTATGYFANTDATNPHSVVVGVNAVLEFDDAGSS